MFHVEHLVDILIDFFLISYIILINLKLKKFYMSFKYKNVPR